MGVLRFSWLQPVASKESGFYYFLRESRPCCFLSATRRERECRITPPQFQSQQSAAAQGNNLAPPEAPQRAAQPARGAGRRGVECGGGGEEENV